MSNKRQTVWLVSMLSLMVILSAYYLFTGNQEKAEWTSQDGEQSDWTDIAVQPHDGHSEDFTLRDDLLEEAGWDDAVQGGANAAGAGDSAEREILRRVQAGATRGDEYFAALDMQRTEELARRTEELMDIVTDPERSGEEVGKAEAELHRLEEMQSKVSDLEDELMRQYKNVVISETDGKWRVVVQTDNLQRSEAVAIIDRVVSDLGASPGRIVVQFVP